MSKVKSKYIDLVEDYINLLKEMKCASERKNGYKKYDITNPSDREKCLNHCLWMLEKMKNDFQNDSEKFMRWLGFVQGQLELLEVFTISQMRKHNVSGEM